MFCLSYSLPPTLLSTILFDQTFNILIIRRIIKCIFSFLSVFLCFLIVCCYLFTRLVNLYPSKVLAHINVPLIILGIVFYLMSILNIVFAINLINICNHTKFTATMHSRIT